jgi:hypothetical protein
MASRCRHWGRPQSKGRAWWTRKSGGARIIYYVVTRKAVLYLLDVYAKSAKEDLSDADKREIRGLIAAIEAET